MSTFPPILCSSHIGFISESYSGQVISDSVFFLLMAVIFKRCGGGNSPIISGFDGSIPLTMCQFVTRNSSPFFLVKKPVPYPLGISSSVAALTKDVCRYVVAAESLFMFQFSPEFC